MRDKYNLNTLPVGMQEGEAEAGAHGHGAAAGGGAGGEAAVAVHAPGVPVIPGMAPEDRVTPSFHKVSVTHSFLSQCVLLVINRCNN